MTFYKIGLRSGAAALTSKVDNVKSFLHREPAGRYQIEALTQRSLLLAPRSSKEWGFAVKNDDGSVDLLLADGSKHPGPRMAR